VNFGILPLLFKDASQLETISAGDNLRIEHLHSQLKPGAELQAQLQRADGSERQLTLVHALSAEDIALVLAGGRLAVNG
jgi:aconitate hydratase